MRWWHHAACIDAGNDDFFPVDTRYAKVWTSARLYCSACPVKAQCLAAALTVDETIDKWGMFGGMTPAERRSHRHMLRQAAARLDQ